MRSDQKVVVVGRTHRYPVATEFGDINVSALTVPWAIKYLFLGATGRNWDVEYVARTSQCDGVAAWPSPQSIKEDSGVYFVCLGH